MLFKFQMLIFEYINIETMNALKLLILLLLSSLMSNASSYYFSTSMGDDSRTAVEAQHLQTPWKTLAKLNAFMPSLQSGDSVLFKCGDVFEGMLIIQKSGTNAKPLVFGSYGTGNKPVISGLTNLKNWKNSNGIWETTCNNCKSNENIVVINNHQQILGRYPNADAGNKGYRIFKKHNGTNQIFDSTLPASPSWTGADIVIRTNHWILDRLHITKDSAGWLSFSPSATYPLMDNSGFIIENSLSSLDQKGEWYFNPLSKTLSIFYGSDSLPLATVEASVIDTLVKIQNQKYISFNNLCFKGSNMKTFQVDNTQNISIVDCSIIFSGMDAITGYGIKNILIKNDSISYINNNVLFSYSCTNATITNNVIKNNALFAGMGQGDDGNYNIINISGSHNSIINNNIDSTGYIPISFSGDSTLVKNNVINYFGLVKDDVGGIYTWTGAGNQSGKGSVIEGNIILNGIGCSAGAYYQPINAMASGIYMDDNTSNVHISGNTVAHCAWSGVFLHNNHNIICNNNTFFNNGNGLGISHQNETCIGCVMQNNTVNNNIFFSKTQEQSVADIGTFKTDIAILASLDSNYYCRPVDEDFDMLVADSLTSNSLSLKDWQQAYGKDIHSKSSPLHFPYYTLSSLIGKNQFSNGTFTSNIGGLYCWSPQGNCNTSWQSKSKLDGGALKFSFISKSNKQNQTYIIIGAGTTDSTKNYVVRFSLLGSKKGKSVGIFLRQSKAPYANLTKMKFVKIDTLRTENEILFTRPISESDASIGFQLNEEDSTIWFDNIGLFVADVSITNPDDYIRFEYNATKSIKTFSIEDTMFDVKQHQYTGTISLKPFSSIILMKRSSLDSSFKPTLIRNILQSNQTLYPNPTSKSFSIDLDKPAQISLYSLNRILLKKQNITGKECISLDGIQKGMYLVKIQTKDGIITKSLIVE